MTNLSISCDSWVFQEPGGVSKRSRQFKVFVWLSGVGRWQPVPHSHALLVKTEGQGLVGVVILEVLQPGLKVSHRFPGRISEKLLEKEMNVVKYCLKFIHLLSRKDKKPLDIFIFCTAFMLMLNKGLHIFCTKCKLVRYVRKEIGAFSCPVCYPLH